MMILVNQATGVPGPGLVVSTLPRNVVFSRFSIRHFHVGLEHDYLDG